MSLKISYNHSSNIYTLYTDFGMIQFGGFSELQDLIEKKKESLGFLSLYSLNRSFLKEVSRKHHKGDGNDGRSAKRRFDVPLKSDVSAKVRCYESKKSDYEIPRSIKFKEQLDEAKHNMNVAIAKAREKHDLSYFSLYLDSYRDYKYYSSGTRYISKASEKELYKKFADEV